MTLSSLSRIVARTLHMEWNLCQKWGVYAQYSHICGIAQVVFPSQIVKSKALVSWLMWSMKSFLLPLDEVINTSWLTGSHATYVTSSLTLTFSFDDYFKYLPSGFLTHWCVLRSTISKPRLYLLSRNWLFPGSQSRRRGLLSLLAWNEYVGPRRPGCTWCIDGHILVC